MWRNLTVPMSCLLWAATYSQMLSNCKKSADTLADRRQQIYSSTHWCPTLLERTFEVATGTAAHAWQPAVPGDLGPAPRVQICREPWRASL